MYDFSQLKKWLSSHNIIYLENFDFSKNSWIKAGGICKIFVTPKNLEEIQKLIVQLKKYKLKYKVLGNMSNVLIRDGIIQTIIINLKHLNSIKNIDTDISVYKDFIVESGVSTSKLSLYLSSNNIPGYEGLVGIPGTIGGGIYMNSSSYGSSLTKNLLSITCIDEIGNIKVLNKEDLGLSYRKSILQTNKFVVLSAKFRFHKSLEKDSGVILNEMKRYKNHRLNFQEKKYPNLGTLFASKKGIYNDLSNYSLKFKILYLIMIFSEKFLIKIYSKSNKETKQRKILSFRKNFKNLYCRLLKIDKNFFSDFTVNCLVNRNSVNSDLLIETVEKFDKTTPNYINLEIEILKNID